MQNTLYNFLNANAKVAKVAYNKLRKMKGLWCEIKTPMNTGSIFGKEDLVEYDDFIKSSRQLLLFGIFTEGTMGGYDFDTFIDGAYALTLWDEKIPLQLADF